MMLMASFVGTCNAAPVTLKELKRVLAYYQSIEQLDVDFKQTKILKDINMKLESEGHLTLKFPDRVEWKVTKPQAMLVELENQKIKITSASGSQSFSQNENPSAKDRRSFESILNWLRLDADGIYQRYIINSASKRRYNFVAKDKSEPVIKALDMELTGNGHLAKLVFHEVSGDEIHILFNKPKVVYRRTR